MSKVSHNIFYAIVLLTYRKPVIDLNGPEGNAFCLLGTAMSLCKQIGISVERRDEIIDEMRSDDYEHLIQTFDKYFGKLVDLER